MLRRFLKAALSKFPSPLDLWLSESARWVGSARHRSSRRATRTALRQLGDPAEVLSGPFKGMAYPIRVGAQGGLIPKLVGSYECELGETIRDVIDRAPQTIIDVGAAEGYYAVGLALRLPSSNVIAYEMETPLHSLVRSLALANGVDDRVSLRAACSVESLRDDLAALSRRNALAGTLIVMDVEGFEKVLLDPMAIPSLREVAVIVEVHDALVPGVGRTIRSRFDSTHEIGVVRSRSRSESDLPPGIRIDHPAELLGEGRTTPMEWLVMRPLATPQRPRS